MLCELIRVTASDGQKLDGAYYSGDSAAATYRPWDGALMVHGVGGNFYESQLLIRLAEQLAAGGVNVVSGNTRGHDFVNLGRTRLGPMRQGADYETVGDSRYDLAAWIDFLRQRGARRIVVIGHSLGAIKGVLTAALHRPSLLAGLIAISPPCLSYSRFLQGPRRRLFERTVEKARLLVDRGAINDLIMAKYPFPLLITAAGYLDKYGPDENYNLLRFAARVACPTLYLYGQVEIDSGSRAFCGVPEALEQLTYETVRPEIRVIPGADHLYSGVLDMLTYHVCDWLGRTDE